MNRSGGCCPCWLPPLCALLPPHPHCPASVDIVAFFPFPLLPHVHAAKEKDAGKRSLEAFFGSRTASAQTRGRSAGRAGASGRPLARPLAAPPAVVAPQTAHIMPAFFRPCLSCRRHGRPLRLWTPGGGQGRRTGLSWGWRQRGASGSVGSSDAVPHQRRAASPPGG